MSAYAVALWTAYCDDCDWESELFDNQYQADRAAIVHNDTHLHEDDA